MNKGIKDYVIIGSSRGLGAALVEEFINKGSFNVIGVSRTNLEKLENYKKWVASGRYRHFELDITSQTCREILKAISSELSPKPVCIIFNAAHIEKDINEDHTINYDIYDKINSVGINGLGNVLFAFEKQLLNYGGIFVGISSFWGIIPPIFLPWLAYPASKAYLNIALRCLRVAWRNNVKVTLVNIGNIGNTEKGILANWIIPTYSMAAKKIIFFLLKKNIPKVINYPFWHFVVYQYFLRFIPENVYLWVFKFYFKIAKIPELKRG